MINRLAVLLGIKRAEQTVTVTATPLLRELSELGYVQKKVTWQGPPTRFDAAFEADCDKKNEIFRRL